MENTNASLTAQEFAAQAIANNTNNTPVTAPENVPATQAADAPPNNKKPQITLAVDPTAMPSAEQKKTPETDAVETDAVDTSTSNDPNFSQFNLTPELKASLRHMGYSTPTPIQAEAIPAALEGQDIMGSAQTGTGKTAAYSIPLVEKLLSDEHAAALILTPTRELGKQVMDVIHQMLGRKSKVNTAFIIGGEPMGKQMAQLRRRPRLIVATPGRLNDHLERGTIQLNKTNFLVLDETDRMLDMGFSVQLDRIAEHLPKKRQTLMFSATLPQNIIKLSGKYLNDPVRVSVGSTINPAKNIKQENIKVSDEGKFKELVSQLQQREGAVIIFMKTKYSTEKLVKKLHNADELDVRAQAIHGDMKQRAREKAIRDMRQHKFNILVATDVVARGLDIPHIEHVINYDLPQVPEDYIHRIGRTARAGAEGEALNLISPADNSKWRAIEELMDPSKKSSGGQRDGRKGGKGKGGRSFSGGNKKGNEGNRRRRDGEGSFNKPFSTSKDGKPSFRKSSKPGGSQEERPSNNPFKKHAGNNGNTNPAEGNAGRDPAKKTFGKPGGKPFGGKSFGGKPGNKPGGKPFRKSTGKPGGKPAFNGKKRIAS